MTKVEFIRATEELHKRCLELLHTKGEDYQEGDCVFKSFESDSADAGITVEQAIQLYMTKHMRVVQKYLKGDEIQSLAEESIQSRIMDAINYLSFVNALIIKRAAEL